MVRRENAIEGDKRTTDETRKDKVIHMKAVVADTSRKVWKP